MSDALLAIELSGPCSTVALQAGGELWERDFTAERGRVLLTEVDALLAEAGVAREDLRAVLCGTGPGSYTGLRIAAAAAQALSFALRIPSAGVQSLHAAALGAPEGATVHLLLDAFRGELYHAALRHRADSPVEEVVAPQVLPRDQAADALGDGALLIGDPALLGEAREGLRVEVLAEEVAPTATSLLEVARRLGLRADGSGIEALPAPAPLYLRPGAYPPKPRA